MLPPGLTLSAQGSMETCRAWDGLSGHWEFVSCALSHCVVKATTAQTMSRESLCIDTVGCGPVIMGSLWQRSG